MAVYLSKMAATVVRSTGPASLLLFAVLGNMIKFFRISHNVSVLTFESLTLVEASVTVSSSMYNLRDNDL